MVLLLVDLRIAHLRIGYLVGNPEVGNPVIIMVNNIIRMTTLLIVIIINVNMIVIIVVNNLYMNDNPARAFFLVTHIELTHHIVGRLQMIIFRIFFIMMLTIMIMMTSS